MRRLAVLFAILVAFSAIEQIVLSMQWNRVVDAPRRIRRAWISLADWRAFLIGPLRLFQRTAARGSGPWPGLSN